jgi:KaiC/GvpD/RAD55 family RecA-like ATPase
MLRGVRSMPAAKKPSNPPGSGIAKCPTGIVGLDQITNGGLPRGRPALICGGAGCGKTLLALEFIVRGAIQFDEPGVFVSFEEMSDELTDNVRSLGFDLDDLVKRKKLAMDYVRVERSEIEESGDYDLEGLFVRLNYAIDLIKPSAWAQIAALQAQILAQDQATEHLIADTQANESRGQLERRAMAVSRKADSASGRSNGKESRK